MGYTVGWARILFWISAHIFPIPTSLQPLQWSQHILEVFPVDECLQSLVHWVSIILLWVRLSRYTSPWGISNSEIFHSFPNVFNQEVKEKGLEWRPFRSWLVGFEVLLAFISVVEDYDFLWQEGGKPFYVKPIQMAFNSLDIICF